ncbi:MAG: hypothetical protein GY898_16265 [Proteobacteria bacterium]|nr:hypothetical protein [Pseudomonadota bacterium]
MGKRLLLLVFLLGCPDNIEPEECVSDLDWDAICDEDDTDRDGDGIENDLDAFPDDPAESADSDGDGVGDNADVCVGDDATGDSDGDGTCDDEDPDRDGDGVDNDADAFPDDPAESADSDGDGVGDNADQCTGDDATGDTDSDGTCDDEDQCTGDDASGDTDGDGTCDDQDSDDDGDGVDDVDDFYPDDPSLSTLYAYIHDYTNNVLHRYDVPTWTHEAFASTAETGGTRMRSVALGDDGWLYVAALGSGLVLRLDPATGDLEDTFLSGLSYPSSLSFDDDGYLNLVTWSGASGCSGMSTVARYDTAGALVDTLATFSGRVHDIVADADGVLLAAEYCGGGIYRVDRSSGADLPTWVGGIYARMYGLVWDPATDTVLTSSWADGNGEALILPVNATGTPGTRFGSGFLKASTLGPDGNLWTPDHHPTLSPTPSVKIYDPVTGAEVEVRPIPEVPYPDSLDLVPG